MLLKDAIKYLELTKCDFITDLSDFAKLQRDFNNGFISDTFTEDYEGFTDKLLILWANSSGGMESVLKQELELPTPTQLIHKYCNVVFENENEKEDENVSFFSSSLIKQKKDNTKNNKTLDLLTFLGNNEININQFMEMELDVVFKVIDLIIEQKKEEERKRKNKKRGL